MIRMIVSSLLLCALVGCGGNSSGSGDDSSDDDSGIDGGGGGGDDGGPPVDEAPIAVDDVASVSKNAAATSIDVLANDTNNDGGPMTIASATNGAHGTVEVSSDGLTLTYQPAADYCSAIADTFTYTLAPFGDTADVTVTIECPWPGTTTFTAQGGQQAWAIAANANGDLFIAGGGNQDFAGNFGAGQQDFLVMKVRADGTREWAKLYGGTGYEEALAIAVAADGSLYVFGNSNSSPFLTAAPVGGTDAILLHLSETGDVLHVGRYGSNTTDIANGGALALLPDGDLVVAGETQGRMNGQNGLPSGQSGDGYVMRVSSDLAMVRWTTQFGTGSVDSATGVALLTDGKLGVSGLTHGLMFTLVGTNNSIDGWVAKLDATTGAIEWGKQFGGTDADYAYGVTAGQDGGFFVSGATRSALFANEASLGNYDYFVGLYENDGDTTWMHRFGGAGDDEAISIIGDGAGGVLVGGYTRTDFDTGMAGGGADVFAARVNVLGTLAWQRAAPLTGDQGAVSIVRVGAALFATGNVALDAFVAKLTLGGAVL